MTDNQLEELGKLLSGTREKLKLSQEDVTRKLNEKSINIIQKTYSNYELGKVKNPKPAVIAGLADILQMPDLPEKYFSINYSKQEVKVLGKVVPSRLTAEEFEDAFPDWRGVPVYNTEVSASFITKYKDESDGKWEPLYYLRDPQFRDCNFAARIAGDSMHSEIRHGDYIVCQEIVDKSIIVYGEIYYVITSNGLETCKYVNALPIYSDDPKDTRKMYDYERVLLVPKNDSISPTPLHKKDILKLYKVKGIVRGY